jgi:hypothetical protein
MEVKVLLKYLKEHVIIRKCLKDENRKQIIQLYYSDH